MVHGSREKREGRAGVKKPQKACSKEAKANKRVERRAASWHGAASRGTENTSAAVYERSRPLVWWTFKVLKGRKEQDKTYCYYLAPRKKPTKPVETSQKHELKDIQNTRVLYLPCRDLHVEL